MGETEEGWGSIGGEGVKREKGAARGIRGGATRRKKLEKR
jgi:hypothetical protein